MGDFSTMHKKIKKIDKHVAVNVHYYGNVLEMTNYKPRNPRVKPLSKNHYVDLATGEIKDYHRNSQRIQSPENLRRTFKNLRRLIVGNFKAGDIWLTLTYQQIDGKPMTDTVRVYKDFKAFWRRFIAKYGSCDYLSNLRTTSIGKLAPARFD